MTNDLTTHSLRETAKLHGMSPGYLSERVRENKPAKGFNLSDFVVLGDDGRVLGFQFPDDYAFPEAKIQEDSKRSFPTNDIKREEAKEKDSAHSRNLPYADFYTTRENPKARRRNSSPRREKRDRKRNSRGLGRLARHLENTALQTIEEDPQTFAAFVLPTVRTAAPVGAAMCAGYYIHEQTGRTGPSVAAGALTYLAADFAFQGDQSLIGKLGRWVAEQIASNSSTEGPTKTEANGKSPDPAVSMYRIGGDGQKTQPPENGVTLSADLRSFGSS